MLKEIRNLVAKLNQARYEYYIEDSPTMTDAEYDILYAQLEVLEEKAGYIEPDSPTQSVGFQVMTELKKVKHEIPMLSLENINSIREVYNFVQKNGESVLSLKMDGLSCRICYNNDGYMEYAATRGNGEEGEDVTHNVKHIKNVPNKIIKNATQYINDGEVITTRDNFENFNKNLPEDKQFSHPRNFAAGSLRQLNSKISSDRNLKFLVWRVVKGVNCKTYSESLKIASDLGFEVVPNIIIEIEDNEEIITKKIEEVRTIAIEHQYPYDGFVIAVNNLKRANSLGVTAHHPQHSKALKETQQSVKTNLKDIEWAVGKTGLVTPTAVFNEIIIDGSKISRATLHNYSVMKELKIGIGDEIEVIKAQKIIPKIVANNTKSDNYMYPTKCPCCGKELTTKQNNISFYGGLGNALLMGDKGPITFWCENPNCGEKNLAKFTQFVSKQGMNIDGFSEKKLEVLIQKGFITDFASIYELKNRPEIAELEGFGEKSYNKLIKSIENSKKTTMKNVLVALCIPNLGKTVAKTLHKAFKGKFEDFISACQQQYDFTVFEDVGETINNSIYEWFKNPTGIDSTFIYDMINSKIFYFDTSEFENNKMLTGKKTEDREVEIDTDNSFCKDKNFVVTGKFNKYKRSELEKMIEDRGGKLISSVSKKTDFLLTNDGESGSSKAVKAKELNISIMSEEEFLKKIGVE